VINSHVPCQLGDTGSNLQDINHPGLIKTGAFTVWPPPAVARVSIELTTSPLWAERSGRLSYLAMVVHRGIEPRATCVSGRPRRPPGSWPADAAGVEPARPRLARVQAGFRHQIGLRTQQRRGRESNSQGRSSTAFGAGPVANRVASPWRRAENSNPTALPAHSSAARPGPRPVHSPYPSRDSNPDVILLRDAALPVGLEGRELRAADRLRTGDLQLGKLAL
jgi:hypothetical protein